MNIKKVLPGFIWRYSEKFLIQLFDLGINILLARKLGPEIYGTIALTNILQSILNIFVNCGFSAALIQKKDTDELDFSSVFYFNIFACLVLYGIVFAAAPLMASFYKRPELTSLIRVMSLTLVISGVKNIQIAYVSRNMLFKRFFFASLGGTIAAGVCALYLAYNGFGIWSLVALSVVDTLIDTVILWFTVKWRPKRIFSIERLRTLLPFGSKILLNTFIDKLYENLRALIIGKIYGTEDLAFYDKGRKYPFTVYTNIVTTINSVMFPAFSREQDRKARFLEMYSRTIKTAVYLTIPLFSGLAACGDLVIKILLTEKWLPCVIFLRLACIGFFFGTINTLSIVAIKSLGLGEDLIRINLIRKTFSLALIFFTMQISVEAIAYSVVAASIFSLIITNIPVRKHIGYGLRELVRDSLPSVLLAGLMVVCVCCVHLLGLKDWQTLILQIITGGIIYVGGSFLFGMEIPRFLINTLRQMKKKQPA